MEVAKTLGRDKDVVVVSILSVIAYLQDSSPLFTVFVWTGR